MNQFFKGLLYYRKALLFIIKNRLSWFFIFPVIIVLLLFFSGVFSTYFTTEFIWEQIKDFLADYAFFQKAWMKGIIGGIIWVGMYFAFYFLFSFTGGFVVLIIMSPIMAVLSEKTEQLATGKKYPFSFIQLTSDVIRGIAIAFRNMIYELFFVILFFILSFIPVIGWIGPILLFFISCYYYGFSFIDYTNERQRRNIRQSVHIVLQNRGGAIAIGMIFYLSLLIPYLRMILPAFVAIISTVAATLYMTEQNYFKNSEKS